MVIQIETSQLSSFLSRIQKMHHKIIHKNAEDLKRGYELLKSGEINVEEFIYYILKEYERIESETTEYAKLYLKQWEALTINDNLEDNLKKTALLLAISKSIDLEKGSSHGILERRHINGEIVEKHTPNSEIRPEIASSDEKRDLIAVRN